MNSGLQNQEKRKKVFVTGATGFVGKNLVNSLTKQGYLVYTLAGDINDPIALPLGVETIFHCAGVIFDTEKLNKVNVLGTENIVKVALENKSKLIHLSSAGAIDPKNAYEISKYKGEKIVLENIKQGLKAHILRPTTIFGGGQNTESNSFLELMRRMRDGSYKNIGQGIYNIVYVDEVVKALIMLAETNIPYGSIYLVNTPISYKNMDAVVKNVAPKINKKTKQVPYFLAWSLAALLTLIYLVIRRKNPLSFSRLRALINEKSYSQNKIVETLHFKNSFSVEEYAKKVCEEYISQGLLS